MKIIFFSLLFIVFEAKAQPIGIQGTLTDNRYFVKAHNIESITYTHCEGRYGDTLCKHQVVTDSTAFNADGFPVAIYHYDWDTWQLDSIVYEFSGDTVIGYHWVKSTGYKGDPNNYIYTFYREFIIKDDRIQEIIVFWFDYDDKPSSSYFLYDNKGNLILFGDTAKADARVHETWKYNDNNQVIEYRYDIGNSNVDHKQMVYNDQNRLSELNDPAVPGHYAKRIRPVHYDEKTGLIDHWDNPTGTHTETHFIRYTFRQ